MEIIHVNLFIIGNDEDVKIAQHTLCRYMRKRSTLDFNDLSVSKNSINATTYANGGGTALKPVVRLRHQTDPQRKENFKANSHCNEIAYANKHLKCKALHQRIDAEPDKTDTGKHSINLQCKQSHTTHHTMHRHTTTTAQKLSAKPRPTTTTLQSQHENPKHSKLHNNENTTS
jgi:hypothetical protein